MGIILLVFPMDLPPGGFSGLSTTTRGSLEVVLFVQLASVPSISLAFATILLPRGFPWLRFGVKWQSPFRLPSHTQIPSWVIAAMESIKTLAAGQTPHQRELCHKRGGTR